MKEEEKKVKNDVGIENELLNILTLEYQQKKQEFEQIPQNEIINEVVRRFREGKNNRRQREEKWIQYLDAYYLKKITPTPTHEWRSKLIPPKPFYIAEQFISVIRRSLLQSKNFFSISSLLPDDLLNQVGVALQRIAEFYLKSFNFIDEFEKALRWGVITGDIIMRINWKTELKQIGLETFLLQYPEFSAISPFDFICDTEKRWACERYFMDIPSVYQLQELQVFRDFPLEPFSPPSEKNIEDWYEKPYFDLSQKEGLCEILEFWGDLYLKDKILEDQHIIIVNRKYLALIETQKFFHNQIPYIVANLFEPLAGTHGYGLFDIIHQLLESYTDFVRIMEDNIKLALSTIIEARKDMLDHSTQETIRKEGLVPFAILWKEGEGDALIGKNYVQFNPNVLPLLQFYNMEIQNATGITEFLMGLPTSKGRPTAREVMLKTQQNIAMMDLITIRIEKKILNELIRKLLLLVVQKEDEAKLNRISGFPLFPDFTRETLARLIEERLAISVWGITEVMHRQEKIDKLISLLEIGQGIPDLNVRKIIENLAVAFGFLPQELFQPPPPPEQVQLQRQMLVQLAIAVLSSVEPEKAFKLLFEHNLPPDVIVEAISLIQQQQKEGGVQ